MKSRREIDEDRIITKINLKKDILTNYVSYETIEEYEKDNYNELKKDKSNMICVKGIQKEINAFLNLGETLVLKMIKKSILPDMLLKYPDYIKAYDNKYWAIDIINYFNELIDKRAKTTYKKGEK